MNRQVFSSLSQSYRTRYLREGSIFFLSFFAIIFHSGIEVSAQKEKGALIRELQQLYRIDLLPQYRKDSKVSLISTCDTTGGNDDGFSGKYSFVRKKGDNLVLADLQGPGVVHRIHTPTPTNKMLALGEPHLLYQSLCSVENSGCHGIGMSGRERYSFTKH